MSVIPSHLQWLQLNVDAVVSNNLILTKKIGEIINCCIWYNLEIITKGYGHEYKDLLYLIIIF